MHPEHVCRTWPTMTTEVLTSMRVAAPSGTGAASAAALLPEWLQLPRAFQAEFQVVQRRGGPKR